VYWITNNAKCRREVKPGITMEKATFNKKLELNLSKKLARFCIWSIILCGTETWILRVVDPKHFEIFEIWC
jgi:hypothetical protein